MSFTPGQYDVMQDAVREWIEKSTFEEDQNTIREMSRSVRTLQSFKQWEPMWELAQKIHNKWVMKRLGGLIARNSPENRFIKLAELVLVDLRKQNKRIRVRIDAMRRRQQASRNANDTAVVTRLLLDEIATIRRSIAHSAPRNSLEKEVVNQEIKELLKEKAQRQMTQWREDIKLRSEACNFNPFTDDPEVKQAMKEKEEEYLKEHPEQRQKEGDNK